MHGLDGHAVASVSCLLSCVYNRTVDTVTLNYVTVCIFTEWRWLSLRQLPAHSSTNNPNIYINIYFIVLPERCNINRIVERAIELQSTNVTTVVCSLLWQKRQSLSQTQLFVFSVVFAVSFGRMRIVCSA